MKNIIRETLFFILSIITGFISICFSNNESASEITRKIVGINQTAKLEYTWLIRCIIVVISLSIVLIIVRLMRLIETSHNILVIKEISKYLTFILAGIPITNAIIGFNLPFEAIGILYIILFCLAFYIICRVITLICTASYDSILDKPIKNHLVQLCIPTSKTTWDVVRVLVKNKKFEECYNIVRSYPTEEFSHKEFFIINEMNITNKKVVDSWYYYLDGALIENIDVYLHKIYEVDPNINWGF